MGYWDIYPPLVKSDRTYSARRNAPADDRRDQAAGAGLCAACSADVSAQALDGSAAAAGQGVGRLHEPGAYDVHPYLLLNLSDKYDGLTTYAHEWGHAMHSLLANAAPAVRAVELSDFHRGSRLDGARAAARQHDGRARQVQGGKALLPRPDHGELSRDLLPPVDARRVPAGDQRPRRPRARGCRARR